MNRIQKALVAELERRALSPTTRVMPRDFVQVGFSFSAYGKTRSAYGLIHTKRQMITLICPLLESAPKPRFGEVARAIVDFNYGIGTGAWQLDTRDGEVTFRIGVDFSGGQPVHQRSMACLLGHLHSAVSNQGRLLERVVSGDDTAAEAQAIFQTLKKKAKASSPLADKEAERVVTGDKKRPPTIEELRQELARLMADEEEEEVRA